jgi:acetyl/propionyl-CoA carboxylase alpha subunit
LNAEDPYNGFLPSAGRLLVAEWPSSEFEAIRIDTGIGDHVGTNYDSLLAKIVAHGPDRETAILQLQKALRTTSIVGIYTNQALLLDISEQAFFIDGQTYIDTIDNWDFGIRPVPLWFATAAATIFSQPIPAPPAPLANMGYWRLA